MSIYARNIRLLICPEYFYPHIGGGEVWIWNVARELARKGYKITVLTYKHSSHLKDEVIDGIHIKRMGLFPIKGSSSYFSRALVQVPGLLFNGLREEFDILIAVQTLPLIPCKLIAFSKKRPIIIVFHDVYGFHFSLRDKGIIKGLIRGGFEHLSLKLEYDKILAVSNSTKEKLVRQGVNPDKISVVYGGVDLKFIDSIEQEKSEKPLVVYVGRLVPHKRVIDLLKAFKIVLKDFPEAQLYIVGDGPQRNYLENLTIKMNIKGSVNFLGFLSEKEKIKILKSAWALVLPSIKEGFGLVLIEALASKTPVIATNLGGPREIVKNGVNGFLIPAFNPIAIASKLKTFLSNSVLVTKFGEKGYEMVKNNFTWEKVADNIEKEIACLL